MYHQKPSRSKLDRIHARPGVPMISVVVPVYRDWSLVKDLLGVLEAQTWRDFEIILVNNDPDEKEIEVSLPYVSVPVRVIDCPAPGSYAARNRGSEHAAGQLLAFTDADCLPDPRWLHGFVSAIDIARDEILVGPVHMFTTETPNDWEIFDAVRGMRQDVFVRHGYGVTANLAINTSLFRALNGFDGTRLSGGDAEFCRRAGRAGVSLRLLHDAIVRHPARDSKELLETKARRIKGGQVGTGPLPRRIIWTIRSLSPPIREMFAYLRERGKPMRWKLIACRIRMHLWAEELREIYRLIFLRHAPERR